MKSLAPPGLRERPMLVLLALVQCVNVIDFVMVLPLGRDLAVPLRFPEAYTGYLGAAYTASAALGGVMGSLRLDRYDRRTVLSVAASGLALGTLAGAFAWNFETLFLARCIAGFFGGPATSASVAIVADCIPVARRGRAMGIVMSAFSVASVAGLPVVLEAARYGWRIPFIIVGALGAVVAVLARWQLPSLTLHLREGMGEEDLAGLIGMLQRPIVVGGYATALVTFAAAFIVIPNGANYVQMNLNYPRERLWLPYLLGGVASFATMRLVGVLVDRIGAARVSAIGAVLMSVAIFVGYASAPPLVPVVAIFLLFQPSGAFRNGANGTLLTRIPAPRERARFGAFQSAVQHIGCALGASLGSAAMHVEDGRIVGMETAAYVAIGLALAVVPGIFMLERSVRALEAMRRSSPGTVAAPEVGEPLRISSP